MFTQHAEACEDPACPIEGTPCTVVIGVEDGVEVWRSHYTADVPVEVRIGEGLEVEDRREDPPVIVEGSGTTLAEYEAVG